MTRALDRKLLRDLWRLKWQVMAIALLIACGVSVTVMAFSAQMALRTAQQRYYQDTRFADVFASAKRAPLSLVERIGRIDGVTDVDPRILRAGLMEIPGMTRPAVVRVISLPDNDRMALNRIVLKQGRLPAPGREDEVVALKTFMDAAGLTLGEKLSAVIGGRRYAFTIVGAALSPEFVYTPSPESMMPDDAHQGVLWAPRRAVEKAAELDGAFNSLSVAVAPGASRLRVMAALDRILAPYGGSSAYERKDQVSNAFLEAELNELSTSARVIPPVFLIVAAMLVHMVVSRMVEAEREQIGLLKAFGYGDLAAATPYLRMAAAIGLVGALAGGALGGWFGVSITDLYRDYMRFPDLEPTFHAGAFLISAGASITAAVAGSFSAVRAAARLSPAVAMQPPRPATYRQGPLQRLALFRALDPPTRIIARNIERFPTRTILTTAGLAASLSLLVGTQFVFASLDRIIEQAYYQVQRWSDSAAFAEPRSVSAAHDVARLPGVLRAEPVRQVPARIRANGVEERIGVVGLDADARFHRPLDAAGRVVPFKGRGLVISEALARKLKVAPGERVWLEVTEGRRPRLALPVAGLAQDFSGFAVYMDRRELNRLMAEGDVTNGVQLMVETDRKPAFYRALAATPQVTGASSRDETVASWRQVTSESFRTTMIFYVGFAAAIAFGVAYNTSRIALAERSRDLATLRVLGFGRGECAYILLGELLVLGLAAIPLGVIGGNLLARGLVLAYSREDMRLPAMMTPAGYGVSLMAYLGAVILAAVLVGRRIWGFDLVSVLKTRE